MGPRKAKRLIGGMRILYSGLLFLADITAMAPGNVASSGWGSSNTTKSVVFD